MTPVSPRMKYPNPVGTIEIFADAPLTATIARVVVENGDARWSDDINNPATETEGAPLYAGAMTIFNGNLATLTLAAQSSGCTIWVYFGR